MVLAKEPLLPSAGEKLNTETEQMSEQLGRIGSRPKSRPGKLYSRGSIDSQTVERSKTWLNLSFNGPLDQGAKTVEELVEIKENEDGDLQGTQEICLREEKGLIASEEDCDSEQEQEETREPYDATGHICYLKACKMFGVVPVSYFLRHMNDENMIMMHHGLGPKGTKALAVPLVTNTFIQKLNLRDNWMEGMGGAAMAEMLKENCYITDADLSENRLGLLGAKTMSAMLLENNTLMQLNLSGNGFEDDAVAHLAEALTRNHKLQALDLSHNNMGKTSGKILGNAIAENTGLKKLNLSWNHIRGEGAVSVVKGLGANIFLLTVDLSYNGLGKEGATALGEALTVNNVLEHLNISNNRIPPGGAISLALGIKANKTIKTLNMSRNPMQAVGCYEILNAMQGNQQSALEHLDFSDITLNQDCVDLHSRVKKMFPNLKVKHGGTVGQSRE